MFSASSPQVVARARLNETLTAWWAELSRGPAAETAPPDQPPAPPAVRWSPAYTPLLPANWPPTRETLWQEYAFAYGLDRQLVDGQRVARPWARVDFHPQRDAVTVTRLHPGLEAFATQGVRPLRPEEAVFFEAAERVRRMVIGLTGAPAPGSPSARDLQSYYQLWFRLQGAIAGLVAPAHADFAAWVRS